jgi:hypothetical protein
VKRNVTVPVGLATRRDTILGDAETADPVRASGFPGRSRTGRGIGSVVKRELAGNPVQAA